MSWEATDIWQRTDDDAWSQVRTAQRAEKSGFVSQGGRPAWKIPERGARHKSPSIECAETSRNKQKSLILRDSSQVLVIVIGQLSLYKSP